MNANIVKALALIDTATDGRFDIWNLAGDSNKPIRQQVMSAIEGVKVPIAKAGVNAIRDKMYAALEVTGSCIAHQDDCFRDIAREALGSATLHE